MKYDIENMVKLYAQGMALRAIGRKKNISSNTVKKYLMLQGIKTETKNIICGIKNKDDLLLGLYVGIWAGDGTQFYDKGYKIKICCDCRNQKLIKFYQECLLDLFGKKSRVATELGNNRAYVIFNSKFIYTLISDYLVFGKNKTHTVHLKHNINSYSKRFLKGFLLGLMLTDGYLKQKFIFNTISEGLACNVVKILNIFGTVARTYIHDRSKYNWKDLHIVTLKKEGCTKISNLLNETLKEAGCSKSFFSLKGYEEMGPP